MYKTKISNILKMFIEVIFLRFECKFLEINLFYFTILYLSKKFCESTQVQVLIVYISCHLKNFKNNFVFRITYVISVVLFVF